MKLTVEIAMDNAAFTEDNSEVSRILRELAETLDGRLSADPYDTNIRLRDINGNTVGQARIK